MTVYIGGSMNAREQCADRAYELRQRGYRIVSTWHSRSEAGQTYAQIAAQDTLEVLRAALVVINADVASSSGGYMTELGLALALGKQVVVIGEYGERNVFAFLPGVERFASWQRYLDWLDTRSTANEFTVGRM